MIPCINDFSMEIISKKEISIYRSKPRECRIVALKSRDYTWDVSIEKDDEKETVTIIKEQGYPIEALTNIMRCT